MGTKGNAVKTAEIKEEKEGEVNKKGKAENRGEAG